MGLMTVEQAKKKVCRKRTMEHLIYGFTFALLRSVSHFRKLPSEVNEVINDHEQPCNPKTCAHWNYTMAKEPIPVEDLEVDDKGEPTTIVTVEAMERVGAETLKEYEANFNKGYCGLSAPLDELQDIANAKTQAQGGV